MWAQMCMRATVGEISGTPTRFAISGETGRGVMIPLGSPLRGDAAACFDAAARVTVRITRTCVAAERERGTEENDGVSPERKVEEIKLAERAMSSKV